MSAKVFRWLLPIVIVAATPGCDNAGRPGSDERQEADQAATRIVPLVPAVTEVLVALGATDRIVGRTDFDTLPEVRTLPSVGGGLGPDLEVLASLRPDLVIRFEGDSDPATPTRLDELGIHHLAVRPDGVADVFEMTRAVGEAIGRAEAAGALADRLRDELAAVRRAAAQHPPVRVAYLMGGTPPWTAGPGSYIDELIAVAGGINVFADLDALYAAVAPEVLASREIDLFVLTEGAQVDERIVRGRRVVRVSGDLQIPGPRLADAARELALLLHEGDPGTAPDPAGSP